MDYEKKIRRLQEHIEHHPCDYQAVISLLVTKSDAIEHAYHERKIERLKKVAEYRRKYNEEYS